MSTGRCSTLVSASELLVEEPDDDVSSLSSTLSDVEELLSDSLDMTYM